MSPKVVNSFHLTLVRHGQTEANRARIIQGQQNVQLSDYGIKQSEMLCNHFKQLNVKFDLVFSSDLDRAIDTCRLIVGANSEIVVDERLRERAFGVIEGQSLETFREEAKKAGYNEQNYSSFTPKDAETLSEVNLRVKSFCDYLPDIVSPDCNVLIVTHGGVIREFVRYFRDNLQCDFNLSEPLRVTPNTGVNLFRIEYNAIELVNALCMKLNDISHLEETAVVLDASVKESVERASELTYQSL